MIVSLKAAVDIVGNHGAFDIGKLRSREFDFNTKFKIIIKHNVRSLCVWWGRAVPRCFHVHKYKHMGKVVNTEDQFNLILILVKNLVRSLRTCRTGG